MKLLILGGSSSRNSGGVFDTARMMGMRLQQQNHINVEYLMFDDEYSPEDKKYYSSLPVHSYTVKGPRKLGLSTDLYKQMKTIQPDIVHTQSLWMYLSYANKKYSRIKSTYKNYRDIGAYSTWFGEKMPVDFDICVLANVLYMVNSYDLPYSSADSASLDLICEMVRKKQHLKAPSYISPYYDRSPVILYHLSRLMSSRHIPQLEVLKPQLVDEALKCYKKSHGVLDKIILSTALYRWGQQPPVETIKLKTDLFTFSETSDFVFFVANMAVVFPNPLNSVVGKSAIAKYYYRCPAYNNVLLLENMIWKKRFDDKRSE